MVMESRTIGPHQGQWAMAWIGSMNRTLQTFKATSTEDQIVMNSLGVDLPTAKHLSRHVIHCWHE